MQIEHDPNERHPSKPSIVTVFAISSALGIGMVVARGGFEGHSYAESVFLAVVGTSAAVAYFTAIHMLLKGWDRLWAKFRGRALQ